MIIKFFVEIKLHKTTSHCGDTKKEEVLKQILNAKPRSTYHSCIDPSKIRLTNRQI